MTAECPECGGEATIVEQSAVVENTVEGFEDGAVLVIHKEWVGDSDFYFSCAKAHTWPVPSDIEVVAL